MRRARSTGSAARHCGHVQLGARESGQAERFDELVRALAEDGEEVGHLAIKVVLDLDRRRAIWSSTLAAPASSSVYASCSGKRPMIDEPITHFPP